MGVTCEHEASFGKLAVGPVGEDRGECLGESDESELPCESESDVLDSVSLEDESPAETCGIS